MVPFSSEVYWPTIFIFVDETELPFHDAIGASDTCQLRVPNKYLDCTVFVEIFNAAFD